MKRRWRQVLSVWLVLLPAASGHAAGVSLAGGVSGDWARIDWAFNQHLSFDDRVHRVMPEFALAFEPWKVLTLDAGVRYQYERDGAGEFQDRYRYYGSATFAWNPADRWALRYRLRWEEEIRDAADGGTRRYRRERLLVRYRLNDRFSPYVSAEAFERFNDGVAGATRNRYTLGTQVRLRGPRELQVYLREGVPADGDPPTNVIGFEFEVRL